MDSVWHQPSELKIFANVRDLTCHIGQFARNNFPGLSMHVFTSRVENSMDPDQNLIFL